MDMWYKYHGPTPFTRAQFLHTHTGPVEQSEPAPRITVREEYMITASARLVVAAFST